MRVAQEQILRCALDGNVRSPRSFRITAALLALTLLSPLTPHPSPLKAQTADQSQRLRAQQEQLAQIRREREDLERRADELRSSVHDLSEELTNLDRRADVTARIVEALAAQLATIADEVSDASSRMAGAEAELAAKRSVLHGRLVDIYKRGPLYTAEALLSAHSFGELVSRYKYLHLLALRDRALVRRVEQLRDETAVEHNRLATLQTALEDNRAEKQREEERLRALEREQTSHLAATKLRAKQTEDRLVRLRQTETQLANAIAGLEATRLRLEGNRPSLLKGSSSIKTTDYGRLDWPVDGPLVYTFGKAQTASNTTIRWNGVGIQATPGTPVRAVAPGTVVQVRPLGTYGLTVIVDHGGGDYSIYGSLYRADVREQQTVVRGQAIGSVGVSDPELPAHLHFEIRHGASSGAVPAAVDPATWLRDRQ